MVGKTTVDPPAPRTIAEMADWSLNVGSAGTAVLADGAAVLVGDPEVRDVQRARRGRERRGGAPRTAGPNAERHTAIVMVVCGCHVPTGNMVATLDVSAGRADQPERG